MDRTAWMANGAIMTLQPVTSDHLATLRFKELTPSDLRRMAFGGAESSTTTSWWQIEADIICHECGAYQGVDSDPTNDQTVAVELALRLFNGTGWRVDRSNKPICADCQTQHRDR